jgi:DNA-binding GntR family transcriptional regulator
MSSKSSEIAAALVRAVLNQRLLPGTKLGERELAEIFGVSRIVVRQALIRVADEGLVSIEQNRGAFVAQPTQAEAFEIYDALTLLEQAVASLVIQRTKGAHLTELRHQVELQKAALDSGNNSAANLLGQEFHGLFIRLGRNRYIEEMHGRLSRKAKLLQTLYRSEFDTCVLIGEHLKLIEFMEAGRLAKAQELIAAHNHLVARGYDLDSSGLSQLPLARAGAAAPAGGRAALAVRPEAIRIMPRSASVDRNEFNVLPAQLISEEFLGILTYLRFRDRENQELLVIRSGQDRTVRPDAGEWYDLTWPVEATTVVPADP